MPHHPRELIEGYTLEIISRSQTIRIRCKKLLSKDFASPAPVSLIKTLERICQYLEEATKSIYRSINWESISSEELEASLRNLQITDYIIRELGEDIFYLDGAITPKLPWSIVKPIEQFTKTLLPEITIMLRAQWVYNYSIVTTDLREKYYSSLSEYQDFLPDMSLEKVFEDFKQPFHIITIPSLERKNILLHCLVGHEIGHLISRTYLTDFRKEEFLKNTRNEIDSIVENSLKNVKEQTDLFKPYAIQQAIENATIAWRRGLEELLSDIIGTLLFGPAMLFSALEIAIQHDMDSKPSPNYNFYPPWRLRLREILKLIQDSFREYIPLQGDIFTEKTIESVNKRFELIKEITQNESDKKTIEDDSILKLAYREIDKDITKACLYFKERLKGSIIEASVLYARLPHLIERIDNGIPPNAYESTVSNREPANIVEIINAAWFHKISWEDCIFDKDGLFNKDICNKRDRMNRLTLKAIEYADIEKTYRNNISKKEGYENNKS